MPVCVGQGAEHELLNLPALLGNFWALLKTRPTTQSIPVTPSPPRTQQHAPVFMGQGEPLLNLPAVLGSFRALNEDLKIGGRCITISTVRRGWKAGGVVAAAGALGGDGRKHWAGMAGALGGEKWVPCHFTLSLSQPILFPHGLL